MTNKEKFIDEIETIITQGNYLLSVEALDYLKYLKKEKIGGNEFTENGKRIFEYMKTLPAETTISAKDIGSALDLTGRSVSGSMRKLVANEYVEKLGNNPVLYRMTSKGHAHNVD